MKITVSGLFDVVLTAFDYVEAGKNPMECTLAAFIDETLSDQSVALF